MKISESHTIRKQYNLLNYDGGDLWLNKYWKSEGEIAGYQPF